MVTTSTTVSGPTTRSPRTVKPTRPPVRSPSSHAIRRAAARAAIRRGSATSTLRAGPPPVSPASTRGTSVVFPVPGGAQSTAAPRSSRARSRAGTAVRTGNWSRTSVRITPPVSYAAPAPRAAGTYAPSRESRSQTKIAVPGIRLPRSGDQPPHSWSFQAGHSGSTRSTSRNPPATTSRTRSPRVL
ncbi:hypothetical protein OKW18_005156 [Streptomyces pratensis]|nr:hypothetical protein [Streptomyces pratensis]